MMMSRFLTFSILLAVFISCVATPPKTKLEKIIFHTTMCFGTCPVYHLEVDQNKNVKLHAEAVFDKKSVGKSFIIDSTQTGYFTGIASDSSFNKLTTQLQTIGLDSLEFDGATCCDGSVITMIVYYDGKRKFLKSMFPPEKARDLIATLYEICKAGNLRRSDTPFDIENEDNSK